MFWKRRQICVYIRRNVLTIFLGISMHAILEIQCVSPIFGWIRKKQFQKKNGDKLEILFFSSIKKFGPVHKYIFSSQFHISLTRRWSSRHFCRKEKFWEVIFSSFFYQVSVRKRYLMTPMRKLMFPFQPWTSRILTKLVKMRLWIQQKRGPNANRFSKTSLTKVSMR